jgi:hypothetical protein
MLMVGSVVHPASRIGDAWAVFKHYAMNAPDHVMLAFGVGHGAEDKVPEEFVGKPVVTVSAYNSGDRGSVEIELKELLAFGQPIAASLTPRPYLELQQSFDEELSWGHRVYTKGGFTDDLPASALEALVDHLVADATPSDGFGLWAQGGAIARVTEDATAFTGREALFQMSSESSWDDPETDEMHIRSARGYFAIVEPYSRIGRYVNDVADSGPDLARLVYGDAKYERLVAVKRTWDPDNVFRLNQNINP